MVSHHCTQDSLPAAGPSFAGRDAYQRGFYERFLSISTRPPFPSFLGASFVLALFCCRQFPTFGFTDCWALSSRPRPTPHDRRGPPSMPRAELGIHGLRSWGRNWSRKVRETRSSSSQKRPEQGQEVLAARWAAYPWTEQMDRKMSRNV